MSTLADRTITNVNVDRLEAILGVLKLICMSPYAPIKIVLSAHLESRDDFEWVRITAVALVEDHSGLGSLNVVVYREVDSVGLTPGVVIAKALDCMRELYYHEFRESVLVNGVRVLDPHKVAI